MLAMLMYDNYRKRFGLLNTSTAEEVALCLGMGEKTEIVEAGVNMYEVRY